MNTEELTTHWKFLKYPFKTFTAERDENLHDYFIEPPYFNDIVGNPEHPSSSIIFGRRGDGKTAILKMVKYRLENQFDDKVLMVVYNDFSGWNKERILNLSLDDHIERILGLAIEQLIREVETDPQILLKLNKVELSQLQWFILRFFPYTHYDQLEERLVKLFDTLPESKRIYYLGGKGLRRIGSYLRRRRVEVEKVANDDSTSLKLIRTIFALIAPSIPGSGDIKNETMIELLAKFKDLALSAGFISIYVFIDKVDETEALSGSLELVARMLSPIVKSINLLEMDKLAVKIFIPSWTRSYIGRDLRTDRILPRDISWTPARLKSMLRRRLLSFSNEINDSLRPFVEDGLWEAFEMQIMYYSALSPRNLIRILDYIVTELCELEISPKLITRAALESGISQFRNVRLLEEDAPEYEQRLRELDIMNHKSDK